MPPIHAAEPAADSKAQIHISDDNACCVAGKSSISVGVLNSGYVDLAYPKSHNAGISLQGKTHVGFWSKMQNGSVHSWGGLRPIVKLYESENKFAVLRSSDDPRNFPQCEREERGDWMYFNIPLNPADNDPLWRRQGELPATVNWIVIEFAPAGGAGPHDTFRVWFDGLGLR